MKNLKAYNAWKRSTLDRLTDKYRRLYSNVYRANLISLSHQMTMAIESGQTSFDFRADHLTPALSKVMIDHRDHVVLTGVSDAIREIGPDKKLSTWLNWPYWYPIEETFTHLAERKVRDNIFKRINKKVRDKHKGLLADIISLDRQRYIKNVKAIFSNLARTYYDDPDSSVPKDVVKDIIIRTLNVTKNHAEMIFRTETTRYFNDARITYFQTDTDVDFVQLVAVTDGRISNICESRDGYVIPISRASDKKFKPPFHPNCRTVQSPLTSDLKSDAQEIKSNLGSEFGKQVSDITDKEFTGRRATPNVPLPRGWA